jgi:hypothetical protein
MDENHLIEHYKLKYRSFPQEYQNDFDIFWKWKKKIESNKEHILDDKYLDRTYNRLCPILKSWQFKRGPKCSDDPLIQLKIALENISEEYSAIKDYTLLEIEQIDLQQLERIWNELGEVKIVKNVDRSKHPLVISICKPLMLMWGQTPAFDSKVRKNFFEDYKNSFIRKNRWSFNEWICALALNYKLLKNNEKFTSYIKNCSKEKYGIDSVVPYGRLLDIYYFDFSLT